jgi:tetratricopeptide (TPR) repeat protein
MTNRSDTRRDEAFALYSAGRDALDEGNRPDAIEQLRRSAVLAPHFKTLELLGECLLEDGHSRDAIVYLAAAAGLGNRQFRSRYLLARALIAIGEPGHAIDKLREALEFQPTYRAARELLDETQRMYGEPDAGVSASVEGG